MIRYLDTSAAVKLLVAEPESRLLRRVARRWSDDHIVSGQLMATELHRVAFRLGLPSARADGLLAAIELVDLERTDFVEARSMEPAEARTLDVLHVVIALRIRADSMVTYDIRRAAVAESVGLSIASPGN